MAVMEGKKRKPPNRTTRQTNVRLPPDIQEFLDRIARQEERTRAMVVTRALRLYAKENGYQWPREEDR